MYVLKSTKSWSSIEESRGSFSTNKIFMGLTFESLLCSLLKRQDRISITYPQLYFMMFHSFLVNSQTWKWTFKCNTLIKVWGNTCYLPPQDLELLNTFCVDSRIQFFTGYTVRIIDKTFLHHHQIFLTYLTNCYL